MTPTSGRGDPHPRETCLFPRNSHPPSPFPKRVYPHFPPPHPPQKKQKHPSIPPPLLTSPLIVQIYPSFFRETAPRCRRPQCLRLAWPEPASRGRIFWAQVVESLNSMVRTIAWGSGSYHYLIKGGQHTTTMIYLRKFPSFA